MLLTTVLPETADLMSRSNKDPTNDRVFAKKIQKRVAQFRKVPKMRLRCQRRHETLKSNN